MMKPSLMMRRLLPALLLAVTLVTARAGDVAEAAKQILDAAKANPDREAVIASHAGQAGELTAALTAGLQPGTPDEYQRIPWLWRVTIAAGKRNQTAELKSLLDVSIPQAGQPLHDWQAVVLGGGVINGLGLVGQWPAERLQDLLSGDKVLQARWEQTLAQAAVMAENTKVPNGTRYDALRILGVDTWSRVGDQLKKYLAKDANGELQQGAVCALVDLRHKNATAALVENLPNFNERNRNFALDGLLKDASRQEALVDGLADGKIKREWLGAEREKQLLASADTSVQAKAAKAFGVAVEKNAAVAGKLYTVGVAKVDITPDYPIFLNGYYARRTAGEADGAIQHIFAKAVAIGTDKEKPAILITVDNCILPGALRPELLKRLAKKGITSDRLAIGTSHTHSAPKLAGAADNIFGMDIPAEAQGRIERYTRELVDNFEKVSLAALADRKPAYLSYGRTAASFGQNRRIKGGPSDPDVPVLQITDKNGQVRGVVVNYACHCTTLADQPNKICGDWAGYAQEYLESAYPGAVALTIIGCGADQNPSPRHGVELAQQHGRSLTTAVTDLLTAKKVVPLAGALECRTEKISLPFDTHPTREEFEKRAADTNNVPVAYHAKKQLARLARGEKLQKELPYLVQTWNFGNDLALVFLPGEVVVDYSLRLKKEYDASRLWVNAYANEVPCYIPSLRVWKEGGYEGGGAMIYYDRPTRLAENTEELIFAALHKILPKSFLTSVSAPAVPADPEHPGAVPAAQAAKTFRTKPGFTVDLVAAEPLIEDPVAIDFGTDGKLWVAEMHDYPLGMNGNNEPGGRIKVLTDENGDGHYDKAVLFVDNLSFPTGLMQWRKGVLICTAPDILYAEDTDGDGKADIVKKLFSGFATHNYQARVNSLRWGLDNWVYGAGGLFGGKIRSELTGEEIECNGRDFRFRPDTGEFEPVNGISQQGRCRDDWENWFGCDNSVFVWNFPLPDRYLRRNPHISAPEPRVFVVKDAEPNKLFPASHTQERFNNPNSANRATSAAGIEIYRDELLGKEYYGNSFGGETVHNLVQRFVLTNSGPTFVGHRAEGEKDKEFLASTDNWSRPVEIRTGRDGALWVVDMYRAVIEHPRWIPAETLAKLDVRAGSDMGRIYRVFPTGKSLRSVRDLTGLSSSRLVALLDTPNGTERDLIQRELFQRQDISAFKALKKLAENSDYPAVRAQALCVLDGLKGLGPEDVIRALNDKHPGVRRIAVRLAEVFLPSANVSNRERIDKVWWNPALPMIREKMETMVHDEDFGVRYQLALSLGEWRDPRAGKALGELVKDSLADAWMRAAILSSASTCPGDVLASILPMAEKTPGRAEMISQLVATAAGAEDIRVLQSVMMSIAPAEGQKPANWQWHALASIQETLDRRKLTIEHFLNFSGGETKEAIQRIETIINGAGDVARDDKAPLDEREVALRLLANSGEEKDAHTLLDLATGDSPPRLQKAALSALQKNRSPALVKTILEDWKEFQFKARPGLLDLLLSRDENVPKVLKAVEKKIITPAEITANHRQNLLAHKNEDIRAKALELFPQNESRKQVLEKFLAEVPKLTGDADKGAVIFAQACTACHAFKGQGTGVGPDLAPLADKPADYFLQAILDPSSIIEPRFIQYAVELKDDRSLNGVISAETSTTITLTQPAGLKEKILRSDIASMKASALSLMPEGLEEGRTSQDLADLIAYMKEQPATFGGASPEKTAAAKKKFLEAGSNGIVKITSAAATESYPGWLGTLPLAYCRQQEGKNILTWETAPAERSLNNDHVYVFRLPVAMGHLSQPAGKFTFKLNDKVSLPFNVTLADATWQTADGKLVLRYEIEENNAEDSNGTLLINVRGDLLDPGRPLTITVEGSASASERWFGIYLLDKNMAANP